MLFYFIKTSLAFMLHEVELQDVYFKDNRKVSFSYNAYILILSFIVHKITNLCNLKVLNPRFFLFYSITFLSKTKSHARSIVYEI